MKAIVAVDKNFGIGYQNELLFKNEEDLKLFKKKTIGGMVIMGRKTWESLPFKPLPGRVNVILSRSGVIQPTEDVKVLKSVGELLVFLEEEENKAKTRWVIGGARIYVELKEYIEEWHVTHFEKSAEKVDAYFDKDMLNDLESMSEKIDEGVVVSVYKKQTKKSVEKSEGNDMGEILMCAMHTETQEKYVLVNNNGEKIWIKTGDDAVNVVFENSQEARFTQGFVHKKGGEYLADEGKEIVENEEYQLYRSQKDLKVYLRPYEMFHGLDENGVKRFLKKSKK